MSSQKNQIDRKVRIELLRARAALERKELCYLSQQIGSSLQPSSILTGLKGQLFHGLSSGLGPSSKTGHWLDFIWSLGKRYPLLVSGASALAGTVVGKKKWRLGAIALTAWRLFGAYQSIQQNKRDSYVRADDPKSRRIMGPF